MVDLCSVSSSRVSRAEEGVCILLANSLLNLGNRSENNAKKIEIENKFEFVLNQSAFTKIHTVPVYKYFDG